MNTFRTHLFTVFLIISALFAGTIVYYGMLEECCTRRDTNAEDSTIMQSVKAYRNDARCPTINHVLTSISYLDKIKDGYLKDATAYRKWLYIFGHMLAVYSILGSIMLLFVARAGWTATPPVYKFILLASFLTASVSYVIPRLMEQEQNAASNWLAYVQYKKQMLYNVRMLEAYELQNDSVACTKLTGVVDSNFKFMADNLTRYYNINTAEAAAYYNRFQDGIKPAAK